jgi:uncharacterized HAD superfamily protein
MRLGFDIDEVVCDLFGPLMETIEEEYGVTISKDQIKSYDLRNEYSGDKELDLEIAGRLMYLATDTGFLMGCKPYEDAAKVLKELRHGGHQLHYISSRPANSVTDNKRWLRWYNIPFDSVTCMGHGTAKGKIAKRYSLDFFIDDYVPNLESMLKYKDRWRKGLLLMDRPWNQGPFDATKITRVYNWKEVQRHLGIHNR